MRIPWGLALALALISSCGNKTDDGDSTDDSGIYGSDGADGSDGGDGTDGSDGGDGTDGTDGTEPGALPDCQADEGLAADLGEARIDGDTLQAEMSYSGGCETHIFRLCWPEPSFMESEPVQTNLEIIHDGPPDPCDAYPTEVVSFDLSPLKAAWIDAYGGSTGTIVLHLRGASGSTSLRYEF